MRRMPKRLLWAVAGLICASLLATGCGETVDAQEALELTDVVTGWFDAGIQDGKNKLVPTVSFRMRNKASASISGVQLNAVFRVIGDLEELGSSFVRGVDASGLAPSASTSTFVLRSTLGYTGEQPRMQMLQHSLFRDAQVEIFAKHGSKNWVKLAQYTIQRQLLTGEQAGTPTAQTPTPGDATPGATAPSSPAPTPESAPAPTPR